MRSNRSNLNPNPNLNLKILLHHLPLLQDNHKKKRKNTSESAPTLNNENLLQNGETRTVPSKQKSAPEPASDVNNDGEIEFPPLSEIRKRAEEKAKKRNYKEIFASDNENESENKSENERNESEDGSNNESSNNDNNEE